MTTAVGGTSARRAGKCRNECHGNAKELSTAALTGEVAFSHSNSCRVTMPRRNRPWCTTRHALTAATAVVSLSMKSEGEICSTAYVPALQLGPVQTSPHALSGLSAWLRSARGQSRCGTADVHRRRTSQSVRMCTQGEIVKTNLSGGGVGKPPPFVSRKLGSFEKMLTQTRDGAGPAEAGVRTLLTPHVWVSASVKASGINKNNSSTVTHTEQMAS